MLILRPTTAGNLYIYYTVPEMIACCGCGVHSSIIFNLIEQSIITAWEVAGAFVSPKSRTLA